ncbi:MAG TPA: PAS domain S-box protein, partial [Polyangiaceae bacterium]
MFDYNAALRWHLDPKSLPGGSVILNRPFSFYETYKQYVWAALTGMGVESTAILALLAMIRTITRKSRATVRAAEERYRSIVEDGTELIGRIARDGTWLFTNGALLRSLNRHSGERPQTTFLSLVAPSERPTIATQLQAISVEYPACSIEHQVDVDSGDSAWISWSCRGLNGVDGDVTEIQMVGRDVTARKRAEEALRQALTRVEQGNNALTRVNENLQGVLDGMQEGLFVCDLKGQIMQLWSRTVVDWFGKPEVGQFVWDYLATDQPRTALTIRIVVEQVAEDLLPFELNASQMPKALRKGDRLYRIDCHQLTRDGVMSEILFMVSDVTAQLLQERAERVRRELPIVVGHLLRDRIGFQDFVDDTGTMLAGLSASPDRAEKRRLLHTLKGNSAIYGLSHFSSQCHALEDRMSDAPDEPSLESVEQLTATWEESLSTLGVFLSDEKDEQVQIGRDEYAELLARITKNEDHARLLQIARTWAHPPLGRVLFVHTVNARQLAARFGKEVHVVLEDNGLRLPSSSLRGFLGSLVHIVR